MATKQEIIDELVARGIDHDPKDLKADLEDLLDAPGEPVDEGPRRTAESHEDVTGLCRQCNKPADHKHIGV